MADIICRWRNGTPQTVVELVNSMPHSKMPNEQFRLFMQKSVWGTDFFRTPYQLACQLGLYYESDDGYYYPRFDHDITEQEAYEYLQFWLPRYYVPNPYVRKDGFNNIKCPTFILFELYKYVKEHANCTYQEAYRAIFKEEANNNTDIVKNYINNFSKVLRFDNSGRLSVTDVEPYKIFDFMDRYDKKSFFDNFAKTNRKQSCVKKLVVKDKVLRDFVLSVVRYLNSIDKLNSIIPYLSFNRSSIKVSKEDCFSLTGMFIETTIDDIRNRNIGTSRWFENEFKLGEKTVYLSTQWNSSGSFQLTLDDFVKMIQCCYGTGYEYKYIDKEFQLWINEGFQMLNNELPLQTIFYGTPGSGKSHKVKEMVEDVDENLVFRTTFHPDSDYASFVGCYKPVMENDVIKYKFTPQAFTKAYVKAWKTREPVYLIIEEINRGNCAQIFGDLFQLLDRKDGVSEYPIDTDNDLKDYLEKELGVGHAGIANGKLRLPSNLNILATMNTSDQSLFPMDSAFKRRWDWECVPVDYENVDSAKYTINIDGKDYLWHDFLENVNARIKKATDSEDKQMGNFFITGNVTENQFVNKVMFYLWNDICKEEFGSLNNFFRNYIDEKKSETEEFSFNDLFTSDKKKLLSKFMEYIEVKSVTDVHPEKSEEESE